MSRLYRVAAMLVVVLSLGLLTSEDSGPGTDDSARNAIGEIQPEYKAWASPVWAPAPGRHESALFALQACLGAGGLAWALIAARKRPREGKGN